QESSPKIYSNGFGVLDSDKQSKRAVMSLVSGQIQSQKGISISLTSLSFSVSLSLFLSLFLSLSFSLSPCRSVFCGGGLGVFFFRWSPSTFSVLTLLWNAWHPCPTSLLVCDCMLVCVCV